MLLNARAYSVMDGVALSASLLEESAETGRLEPTRTITSVIVLTRSPAGLADLAEELGRLLQEWAWVERGV